MNILGFNITLSKIFGTTLSNSEKTNVEDARKVVDTYRTEHNAMTSKSQESGIYVKLIEGLNKLGYTTTDKEHPSDAIDKFFEKNELYNIDELGYTDKEDFYTTATKEDRDTIIAKWK